MPQQETLPVGEANRHLSSLYQEVALLRSVPDRDCYTGAPVCYAYSPVPLLANYRHQEPLHGRSLPDTFWESQKRKAKRQPDLVLWKGKQHVKEARL